MKIGNGSMRLPVGSAFFTVWGGPFPQCPRGMAGVKMAAEIPWKDWQRGLDSMIDVPTRDFQVPDRKLMMDALHRTVDLVLRGEPIYVGCMGGKGRTGLFLAVLAKAFGIKHPVEYVRQHYFSHAVETGEQYWWVEAFPIPPSIRRKVRWVRRQNWNVAWDGYRDLTRKPSQESGTETGRITSQSAQGMRPSFEQELSRLSSISLDKCSV